VIKSMTGCGRGQGLHGGRAFQCEARSVNHKYLDVKVRVPQGLYAFEVLVQNSVRKRLCRGRVDVTVTLGEGSAPLVRPRADLNLAADYVRVFQQLGTTLGLEGRLTVPDLVRLHDVLCTTESTVPLDDSFPLALEHAVDAALQDLETMRLKEGCLLSVELEGRLQTLSSLVVEAEACVPSASAEIKDRLERRVAELLGGVPLDPMRLAQEVALLVDRSDVTEELARLRGHVAHFRTLLKGTDPAGRKLDFLCQELHREATTLGNKTHYAPLATRVVDMKAEIERVREQVQNVE
jgi:uncharacterized protein (TIGR00255 family)